MKRLIFLLCMLLLTLCLYNEKAEAKVQGENRDEIVWEDENKDKGRSLLPIDGYVEDGIVTIYLYACPEMVKISISDLSDSPVYQNIYTNMERMEIDLTSFDKETYEIVIEYEGISFKGELRL